MKTLAATFLLCLVSLFILGYVSVSTDAATAKTLPNFEFKGLDETEGRLSDAKYKDKVVLLAAFSTWQDVSVKQARELEAFHAKHPDVEIIAFVADELSSARDFVSREKLTFQCAKSDGPRINQNFNRVFDTKKGKVLTLNKVPFVILAGKDRKVAFASVGLTTQATLSSELAKLP